MFLLTRHLYKYITILILVILFAIGFTSAHSIQSVDDLAYVVALGIDVGSNNNLKVSFQFTKPSSTSESGTSETVPTVIDSVEATSIDAATNLMNTFISKELNLSHCKVIVFSEEMARRGIEKEISSLVNKVQVRPDSNIIISTCSAEEYIKGVSPSLENLVAKFYEILPRSSEYTGFTANLQLGEFFNQIVCNTCEPIAILR